MSINTEQFTIGEVFTISGRGVAVTIDGETELNIGLEYLAKIFKPDGTQINASAFKEWLLSRNETPIEKEAFMLKDIEQTDIPKGSTIKFYGK